MRTTKCFKHSLALIGVAALLCLGSPATAQSAQPQDHDTTTRQLSSFDDFMDGHPEIAEQLRKDPALVRDREFVKNHPALQDYLQRNPGVGEEISENPQSFMHQEQRFDRQQTRRELGNLDHFLDTHPEIAEQLRKDPSLVNDKKFVANHPELQEFLRSHSGVAQELSQNPDAFMRQEQRFDQREDSRDRGFQRDRDFDRNRDFNQDRDRDTTRGQLASMDRFLDSHPEIAEQLRRDPSLVNNKDFVKSHPELQNYLQQHPAVRQEFSENPNAFMHQEQRFDRREDRFDRQEDRFGRQEGFDHNQRFDRDADRQEIAGFGQFLGSHSEIAEQVSKNPSLLNNREYMENHPALQQYVNTHPGMQDQMKQNPQAFMQSVQQVSQPAPKATALPKPAQPQH